MPEEFSVMGGNKDKVLVPVLPQNFQNKTQQQQQRKDQQESGQRVKAQS